MNPFSDEEQLKTERKKMIEGQLKARGISNLRVLAAFEKIPREQFVPREFLPKVYEDHPLPIGYNQTISQPYVVAYMSEWLDVKLVDRVLEIGTGSGYQTAVLAELAGEVYSIEAIKELHETAKSRLAKLGYRNIHLMHGDGQKGWPSESPFDKIIVTAASEKIPEALVNQLKEGGKMIIPVGGSEQDLILGRKEHGTLVTKPLIGVRFVPIQKEVS